MPGRSRRRVWSIALAAVAALCMWAASAAGAATVVVGNPNASALTTSLYTSAGARATIANVALGEPGANVTSPVNGTIVQWRVSSTGVGLFAIRVLRPESGHYLGAGTSPGNVPSAGVHTFAANLPIQAGDLLAIDIPDYNQNNTGINGRNFGVDGSTFASFNPTLVADGSTSGFEDDFTGQEMLFNADVQYDDTPAPGPSPTPSTPAKKKCKKSKKHRRSAESAKKKCKKKKR
jgi:hypothetical protein